MIDARGSNLWASKPAEKYIKSKLLFILLIILFSNNDLNVLESQPAVKGQLIILPVPLSFSEPVPG